MASSLPSRNIGFRLLAGLILTSVPVSVVSDDSRQDLKFVSGYSGVKDYAEAAVGNDANERVALYQKFVTNRYSNDCSGSGEQFSMSRSFLETPIEHIDELRAAISRIEEEHVLADVRHWVTIAQDKLFVPELTVCIFPYSPDLPFVDRIKRELSGNMGFVETGGVLWTQFIPAAGWLDTLPHMVLHEYHHAARYSFLPELAQSQTLLETIVSEGSAEVFALSIRPEGPSKPFPPLSKHEQARVWNDMEGYLDSTDPAKLQFYVFGDGERIPRLAGYVIGREMALSFIANNPDVPVEEWSRMSAREFLDLSGYAPSQ